MGPNGKESTMWEVEASLNLVGTLWESKGRGKAPGPREKSFGLDLRQGMLTE
jgi:hypothetical protein